MLNISLNEIYSETYKAYRSMGIEWGIAKDGAILSRWLAEHNFYFLGSVLKNTDLYKKGAVSLSLKNNTHKKPFSVALMGLLLVEYVSSGNVKWQGYIYDYKFLIASMAIIAKEQNVNLILKDNKTTIAYTLEKNIYLQKDKINNTNYFYLEPFHSKEKLTLKDLETIKALSVPKVNKNCWERLKQMAFETYVPESETSKTGAGY